MCYNTIVLSSLIFGVSLDTLPASVSPEAGVLLCCSLHRLALPWRIGSIHRRSFAFRDVAAHFRCRSMHSGAFALPIVALPFLCSAVLCIAAPLLVYAEQCSSIADRR